MALLLEARAELIAHRGAVCHEPVVGEGERTAILDDSDEGAAMRPWRSARVSASIQLTKSTTAKTWPGIDSNGV